jgi:hypothetical protein
MKVYLEDPQPAVPDTFDGDSSTTIGDYVLVDYSSIKDVQTGKSNYIFHANEGWILNEDWEEFADDMTVHELKEHGANFLLWGQRIDTKAAACKVPTTARGKAVQVPKGTDKTKKDADKKGADKKGRDKKATQAKEKKRRTKY